MSSFLLKREKVEFFQRSCGWGEQRGLGRQGKGGSHDTFRGKRRKREERKEGKSKQQPLDIAGGMKSRLGGGTANGIMTDFRARRKS